MFTAHIEGYGNGRIPFPAAVPLGVVQTILEKRGFGIWQDYEPHGRLVWEIHGIANSVPVKLKISLCGTKENAPDNRDVLNLFYAMLGNTIERQGIAGSC